MIAKNLRIFKVLGAFGALYALEIAEVSLLAFIAVVAPRWLLLAAILTQFVMLLLGLRFLWLLWSPSAKRSLGLLQNRIAKAGGRGRSHRLAERA